MQIPKDFKLGRRRFKVQSVRKLPRGARGEVYYTPAVVKIALDYTDAQRAETFWHEITHAILHDMSHRFWRDEEFVVDFSKRLAQVVRSARLG